jgi:Leucine-rich repeat (LRR) protein
MARFCLVCFAWLLSLSISFADDPRERQAIDALTLAHYYVGGNPASTVAISDGDIITTAPLKYLKDLPNLRSVRIQGFINFDDGHLINFEGLKKLVSLELDYNENLGDSGMAHLKGLTQLRALSLNDTQVGDLGIEKLKNLTKLERLNLRGTRITDRGLKHLQRFKNLRVLNLARTKVTAAGLKNIENLVNLEILYLYKTEIGDEGMTYLAKMGKLRELWPSGAFADQGLKTLAGLKGLRKLELAHTKVTDRGMLHLATMNGLEWLGLIGTNISGIGLKNLVCKKQLTNVTHLNLDETKVLDDDLKYLKGFPALEVLGLDDTGITDKGLVHLMKLANLRELRVAGTKITEEGLLKLQRQMPNLRIFPMAPKVGAPFLIEESKNRQSQHRG